MGFGVGGLIDGMGEVWIERVCVFTGGLGW